MEPGEMKPAMWLANVQELSSSWMLCTYQLKLDWLLKNNSYAYISFPFQKFIIAVMTSKLGILWELMASRC